MVIGSFIVFVVFLLLFLFVLYFDRRNLFLGIFFIATGLSFTCYSGGNIYFAANCSSNYVFIQFIYAY